MITMIMQCVILSLLLLFSVMNTGAVPTRSIDDFFSDKELRLELKPDKQVYRTGHRIIFKEAPKKASAFFTEIPTYDMDGVYFIRILLKGDKGLPVFTYIENSSNGWQNSGKTIRCTGEKQLVEFLFSVSRKVSKPSYIGIVLQEKGNLIIEGARMDITHKGVILNGNFDKGVSDWNLNGCAEIVKTAENNVLQISFPPRKDSGEANSSPVSVKPNTTYSISYRARGIKQPWTGPLFDFMIVPYQNEWRMITDDVWVQCLTSWQTKKLVFKTNNRQDDYVKFKVIVKEGSCVQFDDFILKEEIADNPAGEIILDTRFQFGHGVYASVPAKNITGVIKIQNKDVRKYALSLQNFQNKEIWHRKEIVSSEEEIPFSVPVPEIGTTSRLVLKLFNQKGEKIFTTEQLLTSYPPKAREVTFRDDGVTLINGRPFFMLAHFWFTRRGDHGNNCDWWYENDLDRGDDMDFLREAGFNTILLCDYRHITVAEKHGLNAIVEYPSIIPEGTPEEKEKFRQEYFKKNRSFRESPALLAYFGPDEAMLGGRPAARLIEGSQMIRDIDPYHPIFYNEAPCGTAEQQKEYAPLGDVIGRDIYPIGAPHGDMESDRTMTAVGKHTDICHESVNRRKPVWMILQALGWKHINRESNCKKPEEIPGLVYPTYEESRFMAYNAILHGATGIMYHYLGYTIHVPDVFWQGLRKVLLELSYLSDVLTSRTNENSPLQCSRKEIRFLVKRLDGVNYYLMTNETASPVQAEFSSCPEKQLNTLFKTGTVQVNRGCFTLHFRPYEVMVMSEKQFASPEKIFHMETYVPYSRQPVLRGKKAGEKK